MGLKNRSLVRRALTPLSPPGRVKTVGASGCDFTTIQGAIDSITTASITQPWVIQIYPGVYAESITCKDYVHLHGIGQTLQGPACVRVVVDELVITVSDSVNISNIRFEVTSGGSHSLYRIINATGVSSTARVVFWNCYFVVNANFTAAAVKLFEGNQAGTVVFAQCLTYFRPVTSGAVICFDNITGSVDLQGFIVSHYLPSGGFSACIFFKAGATLAAPCEISGLVFSREYPSSGTGVVFLQVNSTDVNPPVNLNEVRGTRWIRYGTMIAGAGIANVSGVMVSEQENQACLAVTTDYGVAVSAGISETPALGTKLIVFLNNIRVSVGDGDRTHDCYFSSDGGTTAKKLCNIIAGDLLYWNAVITSIDLDTDDRISFDYSY